MGNRAVITTYSPTGLYDYNRVGVYLHWNGGRDSIESFLMYCNLKGYPSPEKDNYGWARLCQVIGNFFGGTSSVGIDTCGNLDCDNKDNGVYFIENWKIIGRLWFSGQEQKTHSLLEMLIDINKCQPPDEYLPLEVLKRGVELVSG